MCCMHCIVMIVLHIDIDHCFCRNHGPWMTTHTMMVACSDQFSPSSTYRQRPQLSGCTSPLLFLLAFSLETMLSARFGEGLVDKYFVLLVMLTIVDLLDLI